MTDLRFPRRSRLAGVAVLFAVLTVGGCADSTSGAGGETPTPATTPSASPTPTASHPVDTAIGTRVLIDGIGLSFATEDGAVIDEVAYTDSPLSARAKLSEWLETEPLTTAAVSDEYCAPTSDPIVTDVWGDALSVIHISPLTGESQGYQFWVSATGTTVGEIGLTSSVGYGVGDSPDDMITALKGSPRTSTDISAGVTRIYFDQPAAGWTAYAWARDGESIEEIRSPYALEETC